MKFIDYYFRIERPNSRLSLMSSNSEMNYKEFALVKDETEEIQTDDENDDMALLDLSRSRYSSRNLYMSMPFFPESKLCQSI